MPAEWTDAEIELLSAYIDEQLTSSERTALEARLAQDEALRQELAAMRQTVALLRGLPTIQAPRAFTLTPQMVSQAATPLVVLRPPQAASARPRPVRRVWWIPAASAAGVVLLAGVFALTQTNLAPTSGTAQQVAQGPTVTATQMEDFSVFNTAVENAGSGTTLPVLPPQSTSLSQPPLVLTATPPVPVGPPQGETIPPQQQADTEDSEQADGSSASPPILGEAASETPQPTLGVQSQASSATGMMPAPTQADSEPGESVLRETVTETTFGAAETSLATPDPKSAAGMGGAPDIDAVTGMGSINPDPLAPGFTVATFSPVQGTVVAQYDAPFDSAPAANAVPTSTLTLQDTASGTAPQPMPTPREPIWVRWFNTLSAWLQGLLD